MSDNEDNAVEDIYDAEVEQDPETIHDLGTEKQENLRYQTYYKKVQCPPGHQRFNARDNFTEVITQPPVSLETGFQAVASSGRILFAANGPDIHTFDISDKTHLSTWSWPKKKNFPKIPEALKKFLDPNPPGWVVGPEELADLKKQQQAKDKAKEEANAKAKAKGKTKKDGPPQKKRKLNSKQADPVEDEEDDDSESEEEPDDTMVGVIKDSSDDEDVDKLGPFPPRPVNPEIWPSGLEHKDRKPDNQLLNNGNGLNIDGLKYERSSDRPADEMAEGMTINEKYWRRPELRPGMRSEWKHDPSAATTDVPIVHCLTVTTDGKHVVAATSTDKTIWVLEHDGNGKLTLVSERAMPKRPNALALANKDKIVLCADKFGDVYSLPLIERKDIRRKAKATPSLLSRSATPASLKTFQTGANDKTVHSNRNRKAMKNQEAQYEKAKKEATSTPAGGDKQKKDPAENFHHKLIIGHVSMLTDIVVGRTSTIVDAQSGTTIHEELIITADRDEHIRVSRGMPHSYVIDKFLLGHKEFVSRVHIPGGCSNILISGGGDSYIYIWDYLAGELRTKIEMRKELIKKLDIDTDGDPPLAVSGITSYYDAEISQTRVFVICENIPRVFTFRLNHEGLRPSTDKIPKHKPTDLIDLAGNPLGLTTFRTDDSHGIIVTYDPYTAGQTFYYDANPSFIQVIQLDDLENGPKTAEITAAKDVSEKIAFSFRPSWAKALYTMEPLRKNYFARDTTQKDQGGNWGSATSTG